MVGRDSRNLNKPDKIIDEDSRNHFNPFPELIDIFIWECKSVYPTGFSHFFHCIWVNIISMILTIFLFVLYKTLFINILCH